MSIEPKRLAAAFFIPRESEKPTQILSISSILQTAGALNISTNPSIPSDLNGLVDCMWAGMTCKAYLDELRCYYVLQIYFWQSVFLENLWPLDSNVSLEEDATLALVVDFKQACEALLPETAFLITHLWQANHDWILSRAEMVLVKNVESLMEEHLGLLYLDEELMSYCSLNLEGDKRDRLSTSHGNLIFAGQGASRWF